jgi:uncharacterized secreted protein with C-terminal beta-propeller domain
LQVASIFLLTLLPLFCKAQKQWDRFSLWLEEGEIIDVRIPAGSRQVRVLFKHEESQEWKVWQTSHIPDDANGSIYFRVPHEIQRSKIRFEWNGYDPLPYSFYTGKSNFSTRASDPENRNNLLYRAEIAAYSISEDSVTEDDSSEVEESDIWKIVGDYLYFFNQRRGLQIIDLSNPLNPEVRARHRLPASGEQMYVSDNGEFIFLFVRPPHQTWPYQSNLRVLKFKDEEIKEVSDLKLSGFYSESRMVGETLHIVTEEWEATEWKGWNFNYSTVLSSFDLKDPENIEKTSEISTAGAPQVIFSTNEKLAVVTRDPQDYYNGHLVRIYSLSDFSKIPREISLIKPGGRILDKFKIRISGDTLTLISQAKRNSNWNSRYSLLENFNINTGELLGSLELAERETLYATRFDGDFAYIVTFLRVDPLFIVDLRDPSNPTLLSELIVPGWSEYLEVLDNQLFAVGVENSQVTASLFDVSDKANPFLSQRIYMGNENEFTWSEANYDEKAIGKVPAHGLFFIPYETWSNGNQENKLQILKYSNQLLEKGGEISHPMEVRRSVTDSTGIYLFSISGEELVVSNILDTNNPYEVTRVPLSWPTDKLHIMGDCTLQIEDSSTDGWGWGYQFQDQNITLRLTPTDDFDKLIHSYNAGPGRLLGSLVENDLIHLAILKDGNLSVQMLEVDDEKIILLAKTKSSLQNTSYGFEMEAFVFGDNLICWATKANTYSYFMPMARRSGIMIDHWYPYPYNSTTVVDVQVFEYEKNLVNSFINRESNSSLSMKASETSGPYLIGNKLIYGATDNIDHYNDYNVVASETNSSLYQIDLTNPELPAILPPIPSPGLVIGAQHNESASDNGYLYFENQEVQIGNYRPTPWIQENSIYQDFGRSMSVCAYDGTNIYLLTELNLSDTSGPIEINQEASFIAHSERDAKGIDAYKIQENGSLLLIDSIFQSYNIQQLVSQKGILIGKSDNGMHVSENLLEWPKQELSGNFYIDLQDFSTSEFGLGVATGNYGVEWFNRPDSISQNSSDNPYNFIPPADDDFVTMALVPYYNPTTGNTWIAPTGGWKAPEGWVAGTKEDYETGINLRRSRTSNDWKELTTEYIQIFEADKAPIFFDVNATKAWKYRPSTTIDLQVEELDGKWKNQSWFGNFYDLSFPWIYHTELQWLYFSESSDGSFWLWSKELGWIWTQASAFPYCFSNSNEGWLYLDLKDRNSLRYYDFNSEDWIKFN